MKGYLKNERPFSFQENFPIYSRYFRLFFTFLFFLAFGAGLYDWYLNVYAGEWTDAEKRQYVETAYQETLLRENVFRGVVSSVSRLTESHATDVKIGNDLFLPSPVTATLKKK